MPVAQSARGAAASNESNQSLRVQKQSSDDKQGVNTLFRFFLSVFNIKMYPLILETLSITMLRLTGFYCSI